MRRHKRKPPMSDINVVPYIDVMLVLLIIFMVTAPLLQQGVEVDLPEVAANPIEGDADDIDNLVVSVDAEGNYYLNTGDGADQPKLSDEIEKYVATVLRNKPETKVMLRGDKNASYGMVMAAMVLLQQAGVSSVGFLTDPSEQQDQ
ncbi:MAG: protein TolR [Gammaproteobacteria bacterium]|nr:MAG: protein TolR [Gammaproteobacteria bacterium]